MTALRIRPAERKNSAERAKIWTILEPVIRAGETYPLPRDMTEKAALAYWVSSLHDTYVAEDETGIIGTYYIRPNNSGGGAHIANCGYMVLPQARGKGVARAMCAHSIEIGRQSGYRGIQFNFVIASNEGAVHLWTNMGFETLCRLPGVFDHPRFGYVDALVMYQSLV